MHLRTYAVVETRAGDEEYHLAGGGYLIVAPKRGVQETFDNLQSILQSEAFKHMTPGAFDYIDLRFGNRVFLKEHIETPETAAPSGEGAAGE